MLCCKEGGDKGFLRDVLKRLENFLPVPDLRYFSVPGFSFGILESIIRSKVRRALCD